MPEPKVYFRNWGARAMIGPLHAWEVGDEVDIPARGPKYGDSGDPGFRGVVVRIAQDGMAMVADKAHLERQQQLREAA